MSELEELRAALRSANTVCRSMHAIAQRRGVETNWPAFKKKLDKSLKIQREAMKLEV